MRCICLNCNYTLRLSQDEKYLVCQNCGDKQYVRDLEIGFEEDDEEYLDMFKEGLSSAT